MERDSEYELEEDTLSDSSRERNIQQRKPHKGGKHIREEPTSLRELQACPLAISCLNISHVLVFVKWWKGLNFIMS
jgi:hypothetical protein